MVETRIPRRLRWIPVPDGRAPGPTTMLGRPARGASPALRGGRRREQATRGYIRKRLLALGPHGPRVRQAHGRHRLRLHD